MSDGRIEFLLVEDNEHDIRAIERAWQKAGLVHRLHIVPGGKTCLRFLKNRKQRISDDALLLPLVVLLNDQMATKDGVEVLREIREDDELCHLPVVMLMASRENYRQLKTYRLGANAYIVKPFKFDELVKVVDIVARFWELAEIPETNGEH